MGGVTTALIGGGAALAGNILQSNARRSAANAAADAAQFRPFNLGGAFGDVFFDPRGAAYFNENPDISAARGRLRDFGTQAGLELPGMLESQMLAAQGLPTDFLGAQFDTDAALRQVRNAVGGFTSGANTLGRAANRLGGEVLGIGTGAGVADNVANFAIGQGAGLLSGGIGDVVGDTLSRLRAQARPAEERAVNSRVQSLFNRGTLSDTSGARALGELALTQENADIQRQQLAEGLGLQRFSANQNAGQGLLGMGAGNLLQGRSLQQQLASLYGANQLGGINARSGLLSNILNANLQGANALQSRGARRLANAQGLLGFTQQFDTNQLNQYLASTQGMLNLNADARAAIGLGGNIGGQQAAAGANQAQALLSNNASPFGGFLGGLGNSVLDHVLPGLLGGDGE